MSTLNRIPPRLLSCRILPHADARLCHSLGAPSGTQSLALITCDQDDTLYAALDHATKMAEVSVVFARSFYAGSAHASGPLSGEILGVLAARDPDIVEQGVRALRLALDELFAFYAVGGSGVNVFPTVIPRVGEYLSAQAGIAAGAPFGYFIAPPIEAMLAMDAALKAANVELLKLFSPPTETNFGGGWVTGPLDAVQAAAHAFAETVIDVAARPMSA